MFLGIYNKFWSVNDIYVQNRDLFFFSETLRLKKCYPGVQLLNGLHILPINVSPVIGAYNVANSYCGTLSLAIKALPNTSSSRHLDSIIM